MGVLTVFLVFLALPVFGCMGDLGPEEIREDVERQAEITEELAKTADRVFIGEVASVSKSRTSAHFRVLEPIKGESLEPEIQLHLRDDAGTVVACEAWRMFRNVYFRRGIRYIVYASGNRLLRTGPVNRIDWDISFDREISIVKRVANDT